MEYDARIHQFVATPNYNASDWTDEDLTRWGLKDLQRWGKQDLLRWGREEMVRWDEKQKIEKEIDELTVKLDDANARWERNSSTATDVPRPHSVDSGISMDESTKPSYMRSTTASKRKTISATRLDLRGSSSSPAASDTSEKKHSHLEPQKNHISDFGIVDLSIRAATQASQTKRLPPHGLAFLRRGKRPASPLECDDWECDRRVDACSARVDCLNTPYRKEPPKCKNCKARIEDGQVALCTQCDADEAAVPALADTSRLHASYESCGTEGPIPFHIQLDYMRRSENIAKEAVWLALRAHYPKTQQQRFPEGPEQIRFGQEDLLRDGFGAPEYPAECNEMCGELRASVYYALFDMRFLRNSIAHVVFCTPSGLDSLMHAAQRLAVMLRNGKLAMEVRGMRDEIQELSRASWDDMVRNHELVIQGKDVKWKVHHQRFFDQYRRCESALPDPVAQAASDWNRAHDGVGEDEDFKLRVEKVKSWTYWKHTVDGEDIGVTSYADRLDASGGEDVSRSLTSDS